MSDYLARPKSTPRSGVLVLHAWWGLNDFFILLCKRLADEGFIALAPDMYGGEITTTIADAEKLRKKKIKRDATAKQILAALDQLKVEAGDAPLGLIGFSLGAYWGLWLVEEKPKDIVATVLFYGSRGGHFVKTKSAFLGHFAETDEFVAASGRKKLEKELKAAGREVAFHIYPDTRHWFFETDRPEYNPEAAELAWQRTVEFLHIHLRESK